MADTVNQGATPTAPAAEPTAPAADRLFTQEEVNGIIEERLRRERGKYADYDALREKAEKYDASEARVGELQQQLDALSQADAVRTVRAKVAKDTGVPVDLLTCDTEEACTAQAQSILDFAKADAYPVVRDGGEPTRAPKGGPEEDFKAWFENAMK